MCISYSVGIGGRNDQADVRIVQILFNVNRGRFPEPLPAELSTDGQIGPNTIQAIRSFETVVMKLPASDGVVTPGDITMKALLAGLMPGVSKDKVCIILPLALRKYVDLYFDPLVAGMAKYKIDTPLQIAHFMAQIGLESGNFLYSEELASGAAYEGATRLGNTQPGDGTKYKGRGLIQLTGRTNYTAYSKYTKVDYLSNPAPIASDPKLSVDVACWFWVDRKIGPLADADDVRGVTRRINGAEDGPHTHLDERIANLNRAKAVLGL
jgi:putative chitinase